MDHHRLLATEYSDQLPEALDVLKRRNVAFHRNGDGLDALAAADFVERFTRRANGNNLISIHLTQLPKKSVAEGVQRSGDCRCADYLHRLIH